MNANKQDAGGLPELPKEAAGYMRGCNIDLQEGDLLFTADQMRAYGELCRAAPAGGDAEVVRLRQLLAGTQEQFRVVSELLERNQAHHERMMKLMDSAPAGSGEVEELATRIDREVRAWESWREEDPDEYPITTVDLLMKAAALLRKLQQGADYTRVGWLSVGPSRDVSFGVNNRSVENRPGTYDLYIASQDQEGGTNG